MNCNDGTQNPPRLRLDLNLGTLANLPAFSQAPQGSDEQRYAGIKAAGYEGIQGGDPALARKHGLGWSTGGRVNAVGEADPLARKAKEEGADCVTLHVGWGMEDDEDIDALIGDILDAQTKHAIPLYVETHRATITQDVWRTVQFTNRYPDIRFNGDFSHWYTGLEMPYGNFGAKLDFAETVFHRVRFMHGRIGNAGCMQVDIGDGGAPSVEAFAEMWTRSFRGFLETANPGDYISFAPELLAPPNYARTFRNAGGELVEESDRWRQALVYCRIANECFAAAQKTI